jgi:hypothetical protein
MLAVAYVIGRATHARQVKGDDPDEKGYPGPPGWGLGVRLTTPPHKKYCYETSRGGQGPPRAVEPMMMITAIRDLLSAFPALDDSANKFYSFPHKLRVAQILLLT